MGMVSNQDAELSKMMTQFKESANAITNDNLSSSLHYTQKTGQSN